MVIRERSKGVVRFPSVSNEIRCCTRSDTFEVERPLVYCPIPGAGVRDRLYSCWNEHGKKQLLILEDLGVCVGYVRAIQPDTGVCHLAIIGTGETPYYDEPRDFR